MDRNASALISGAAVLAAAAVGARNGPQRPLTAVWYAALRKPEHTPPGPVVGGVWGTLELLLAATGYRLLRAPATTARGVALGAWSATLVGLAGYPWLFFRRKRLGPSAVASGGMFAAATALGLAAREADKPAAAMTVPLVVWLGLATVLSEELWRRNPHLDRPPFA